MKYAKTKTDSQQFELQIHIHTKRKQKQFITQTQRRRGASTQSNSKSERVERTILNSKNLETQHITSNDKHSFVVKLNVSRHKQRSYNKTMRIFTANFTRI